MDSKTAIYGAGPGVSLDEDRISTLPDHLLDHILSSFPLSDDTAGIAKSVDKVRRILIFLEYIWPKTHNAPAPDIHVSNWLFA
jgi:hypothetical protein